MAAAWGSLQWGVSYDPPLQGTPAGSAIYLTGRQVHFAIKQMLKGCKTIRAVLPVDIMIPVVVDL